MNEQIKELFEQAYGGEWPTDITNIAPSELERFANLLVKECLKVIDNDIKYNQLILTPDTQYKIHNLASLKSIKSKIKNHFGIE
jgi:hypothetical protein